MLYHTPFPAADAMSVNTNQNVQATSQTTMVYCLFEKFHDSAIYCEFIWIYVLVSKIYMFYTWLINSDFIEKLHTTHKTEVITV